MRSIKTNMALNLLSEWQVITPTAKRANLHPGAVRYRFRSMIKGSSSCGYTYQYLTFELSIIRNPKNMVATVLIPNIMLSVSSLSIFRLDVSTDSGNRYQITYMILLTIVATNYITKDKLPATFYLTAVDYLLLALQFGVYLTLLSTITAEPIADTFNVSISDVNVYWCGFCGGYFGLVIIIYTVMFITIRRRSDFSVKEFQIDAKKSWQIENDRLMKMGYGKLSVTRPSVIFPFEMTRKGAMQRLKREQEENVTFRKCFDNVLREIVTKNTNFGKKKITNNNKSSGNNTSNTTVIFSPVSSTLIGNLSTSATTSSSISLPVNNGITTPDTNNNNISTEIIINDQNVNV
jgi:hypothetical protein